MTDAMLANIADHLRSKGIDCQTVHKMMLGNEDSRVKITDAQILKFLMDSKGGVALITADKDLADHCEAQGVPCVRVQDAIADYLKRRT